jgi:hypothetical protein
VACVAHGPPDALAEDHAPARGPAPENGFEGVPRALGRRGSVGGGDLALLPRRRRGRVRGRTPSVRDVPGACRPAARSSRTADRGASVPVAGRGAGGASPADAGDGRSRRHALPATRGGRDAGRRPVPRRTSRGPRTSTRRSVWRAPPSMPTGGPGR